MYTFSCIGFPIRSLGKARSNCLNLPLVSCEGEIIFFLFVALQYEIIIFVFSCWIAGLFMNFLLYLRFILVITIWKLNDSGRIFLHLIIFFCFFFLFQNLCMMVYYINHCWVPLALYEFFYSHTKLGVESFWLTKTLSSVLKLWLACSIEFMYKILSSLEYEILT